MIIYDKTKMNDVSVVGGKGFGLAKLATYGYNVPDFFVITADTDIFNEAFRDELYYFAGKLDAEKFSVRSSCVEEDGAENSYAGQFRTKLDVEIGGLYDAVKEVRASYVNYGYSHRLSVGVSGISIVVQKMIPGVRSGVLFTVSPFFGDKAVVECVDGTCNKLVGGRITPRQYLVDRSRPTEFNELVSAALTLEKKEGHALDIEWTEAEKLYFLQMRPMTALGDAMPEIPTRNWNFYVYRDFCFLCQSVQRQAADPVLQEKLFGFGVPIWEGLLINGREYYSDENDNRAYEVWQRQDKGDFFEKFIRKIKNSVAKTKAYANSLKKLPVGSLPNRELFAEYNRQIKRYIKSYVPLMMRPDDYLLKKLEDKGLTEAIPTILSFPKKTLYSGEREAFLKAKLSGDAESYLDKYEWVNAPLNKKGVALTKDDILKRFDEITFKQAQDALKKLAKKRYDDRRAYLKLLEEVSDERLIKLMSEFIYLRTYTAENSDRFFFYIRNRLLSEIAKRKQVQIEELMYLTPNEISSLETSDPDKKEIDRRKRGILITFLGGRSDVYFGAATYMLQKALMSYDDSSSDIVGSIASMGEVEGVVRIVHGFEDASKIGSGEIVVTSMTTPEIVSALEKAGGIITDEGGITCHASIIAREYAIPCLVGTRNATSLLKDGMKVKLDCINGTVKIIK